MGSYRNTEIDGDLSVGRKITAGGDLTVRGKATFGHDVKVEGWLEAPNIKDINKGIYLSYNDLMEHYPTPQDGWLAGVVETVSGGKQMTAYLAVEEQWVKQDYALEVDMDMEELVRLQHSMGYFECDTAAATAAKTVIDGSYQLPELAPYGGSVKIKFDHANTAANPTLSISGCKAKPLYYDGARASESNTWADGETVEVYYDGANFQANNVAGGGNFDTGEKVKNIGIDDEPTANSDNLVKSRGVYKGIRSIIDSDNNSNTDLDFSDELGYVLARFSNGHFRTKNFDSKETTKIKTDASNAELNITDEDGNVILQLKNGHIKTKNFDSKDFSQKIQNLSINYPNEVVSVTTLNQNVSFNSVDIFGNTLEFDFKWVGGCLAPNGRIYGIPNGNRQVLEIDPETGRYCLFGYTSSGNFKWSGCAVSENGLIYGMPRSANSVLVIDPVSQSVKEHSIGTNYGQDHHYGGCIVGKKIYLAPRTANHILVINIDDWSTYRLGEDILTTVTRYSAVLKHPNGYIYFIPERNARLLKLDPNTDTIVECGNIISSCSVYGAAIDPSTLNIYGFTGYRNEGGIMKIDVNNSDELTFIHESEVGTGYYGSKLGINGKIYSIVGDGTILYEYDPINDTVKDIATISDTEGGNYNEAKCAGGVLSEDGSIYFIPAKGRHIYKLNFGKIVNTLSRKVLFSSYFSNY